MFKTILHPTDFSEQADHAFRTACSLARDYRARLLVLHVGQRPLIVPADGIVLPGPEHYEEELTTRVCKLRDQAPGVTVECRLAFSDHPAAEIVRDARESGCDLIVLGTHGRSGLARLLMGSVAEEVVRKAPCPVLTVRLPGPGSQLSSPQEAAVADKALQAIPV